MIPYGKQDINEEDINAVINVLKSDWLTQGPKVPEFEHAISQYCQAKHAIAVNSATSALHIACLSLGVTRGDIVWTSPISFVASANCALYCGAQIDFVDIDIDTVNISLTALADKLEKAKRKNKLPKAIIVVHMGGASAQMSEIYELVSPYNIAIIEDASHAIGGRYLNQPVGSCQFSDICVFSFHPVKIITSAEGGIATTNNPLLAEKMAVLRSHGIIKEKSQFQGDHKDSWYYEQQHLGFNYRMTDLNAALGISQIKRLDKFVTQRHQLAYSYRQALTELPLTFQQKNDHCYSAYHLMLMRLTKDATISRKALFNQLKHKNIGVNVHYIPIHLQPYYQKLGFAQGDFPQAENYYHHCISLPLYPGLTDNDLSYVIDAVTEALND